MKMCQLRRDNFKMFKSEMTGRIKTESRGVNKMKGMAMVEVTLGFYAI